MVAPFAPGPCSFFHENHRLLSRHGHDGACAFGELGICPGAMQSGEPVLNTPTSTHLPIGIRLLQPQRLGPSRKSGYEHLPTSEPSQPIKRLAHDSGGEAREARTRIGVVVPWADSSERHVETAQILLFPSGVILPAPSCVIGE